MKPKFLQLKTGDPIIRGDQVFNYGHWGRADAWKWHGHVGDTGFSNRYRRPINHEAQTRVRIHDDGK